MFASNNSQPLSDTLYLLDTNILVHYVRGDATQQRLEKQYQLLMTENVPLISYVTEAELRSLARQFKWGARNIEQMEFFLSIFRRVPIDASGIMDAYVAIDNFKPSRGAVKMGKNDLWIAATASVASATLLTTDKDFDHLDPLFLSRVWVDPNQMS